MSLPSSCDLANAFSRLFPCKPALQGAKKAEACSLENNRKRYVTIHRRITQDSREQSAKSQQFYAILFCAHHDEKG
jgi:hypothetical protein